MGKYTNILLAGAAVVMVAIGVAAQTGTISIPRGNGAQHGAVLGSGAAPALSSPEAKPSPTDNPPQPAPASPPAAPEQSTKHGDDNQGDDGGDGGD